MKETLTILLTVLGGLGIFLLGMKHLSEGLQAAAGNGLRKFMSNATKHRIVGVMSGIVSTIIVQSSSIITVMLVGFVSTALMTLPQAFAVLIGANIGTTVTGQLVSLKVTDLALPAVVLGVVGLMIARRSIMRGAWRTVLGFGLLFFGMNMMSHELKALAKLPEFISFFSHFDCAPSAGGYLPFGAVLGAIAVGTLCTGAVQSSSATIGILQAFAMTGVLTFKGIYAVLVGIYLGDCVTTAIVCSIGAKPDAKRVGVVHILFNLSETVLVFLFVTVLHKLGVLDGIWNKTITSGGIANTNTVFNLSCAILLLPMVHVYEVLSCKLIKGEKTNVNPYADKLAALDPKFYITPAIAFNSCYNALLAMYTAARNNIDKGYAGLMDFNTVDFEAVNAEEDHIDEFADKLSGYLVNMAPYIQTETHTQVMNQYYKLISEFERLGDHALNISEAARDLAETGHKFSDAAEKELKVLKQLINRILDCAYQAFVKRDLTAAKQIEPLEEVVDDMINTLRENHLTRLAKGECCVDVDNIFLNLLGDIERISDICSNIGISVIARIDPSISSQAHNYISKLHSGSDAEFNRIYDSAHKMYFAFLTDNK